MSTLTREQIAEFKEAFSLFDRDGGGTIDSSELGSVMELLGQSPTEDDIKDSSYLSSKPFADEIIVMKGVDGDRDGVVDFKEFLQMMQTMMKKGDLEISDAVHILDEVELGLIFLFFYEKRTMTGRSRFSS